MMLVLMQILLSNGGYKMSKVDIEKLIYKKPMLVTGDLKLIQVLKADSNEGSDEMDPDEPWQPDPGSGTGGNSGF